jgi:uncharacterized protein YbjT (DUF2867 family)
LAVAAPASAQPIARTALIAGANGLTGSALVRLLIHSNDYTRVHALTRRPLPLENPRLTNRILKYEELAARLAGTRCDDAFCCLGAAGGPRAGLAALRRVDLELALAFAQAARGAGAGRLVVISVAGAAPGSGKDFQRTKGELETALRELKFSALDFLQPGTVVGERPGGGAVDTLRHVVAPLVNLTRVGSFADSRWISGADLAAAMLGAARGQRRGISSYSGRRLLQLTSAGTRSD